MKKHCASFFFFFFYVDVHHFHALYDEFEGNLDWTNNENDLKEQQHSSKVQLLKTLVNNS